MDESGLASNRRCVLVYSGNYELKVAVFLVKAKHEQSLRAIQKLRYDGDLTDREKYDRFIRSCAASGVPLYYCNAHELPPLTGVQKRGAHSKEQWNGRRRRPVFSGHRNMPGAGSSNGRERSVKATRRWIGRRKSDAEAKSEKKSKR